MINCPVGTRLGVNLLASWEEFRSFRGEFDLWEVRSLLRSDTSSRGKSNTMCKFSPMKRANLHYFCTRDCQKYHLFNAGWEEGVTQVEQVYAQMDLERGFGSWACCRFHAPFVPLTIIVGSTPSVMELMPGFTARPRDRFIKGWREIGGDRRRIKGV